MILKNKAVKTILKILLIIAIAVIALVITFYAVFYFGIIKGQENFEKEYVGKPNHITSLSDLENVKFDLDEFITNGTGCDCYYTIDFADILHGVDCAHISGRIDVSEDFYNKLLNGYDDFEERSGAPDLCALYHTEYHYYESDAENLFIDFARKNKYLFSQKCFDEKNVVYLLDENVSAVYIYGQYFS